MQTGEGRGYMLMMAILVENRIYCRNTLFLERNRVFESCFSKNIIFLNEEVIRVDVKCSMQQLI